MDKKIDRTFAGLRGALFDEVDMLRNGAGDSERIQLLCKLAGRVHDSIHAEAKARKLLGADVAADGMKGMLS